MTKSSEEHGHATEADASVRDEIERLRNKVSRLERMLDGVLAGANRTVMPKNVFAGDRVEIDRTVRLQAGSDESRIVVGENSRIYRNGDLLGPVTIGVDVFINRDCYIRPGATIGDRCSIGPFVRIITDSHLIGSHKKRAGRNHWDPVIIGDGVWVGAGVTILGGVTIGDGSVVAAGSVVVADILPDTLAAGVPARRVRDL